MSECDVLDCLTKLNVVQHPSGFDITKKASLKGKVIVLDLFESTCHSCIQSFHLQNELYKRYKHDDLLMIAISNEPIEKIKSVIKDINFFVCMDDKHVFDKLKQQYQVHTLPHTFVLDTDGSIKFSGHPDKCESTIEGLFTGTLKGNVGNVGNFERVGNVGNKDRPVYSESGKKECGCPVSKDCTTECSSQCAKDSSCCGTQQQRGVRQQ